MCLPQIAMVTEETESLTQKVCFDTDSVQWGIDNLAYNEFQNQLSWWQEN
jgi:hypothetical protein